jgi:hypothetical protein
MLHMSLTVLLPPAWHGTRILPGQRVRVCQMIVGRNGCWETRAEGEVISLGPEPTGSWYAHGKNDKLWLMRLRLRKPDGEITTLALDQNSRVDFLN